MPTGIYIRTEKNKHTEATKELLRKINTGSGNPQFGKTTSEKQKKTVSELSKGNKWALGYKFTDEQRKRLSAAAIGRKYSKEVKDRWSVVQKESYRKNPERAINISRANKGRDNFWMKGSLNPRWIVDRSKLAKRQERNDSAYHEWRRQVWLRDKFVCKIANPDCLGRIEAHHILGWKDHPELRYNINNGITLCHFHHPRKRVDEIKLSPYFQSLVISNSN